MPEAQQPKKLSLFDVTSIVIGDGLVADSGFSFPSGHTTGSIVFCGLIAYFVWQRWRTPKQRALAVTFFVTISSAVGFDRIYLNVHWFSDVLGGMMLGLFWLTFSIMLFQLLKAYGKFQIVRSSF